MQIFKYVNIIIIKGLLHGFPLLPAPSMCACVCVRESVITCNSYMCSVLFVYQKFEVLSMMSSPPSDRHPIADWDLSPAPETVKVRIDSEARLFIDGSFAPAADGRTCQV